MERSDAINELAAALAKAQGAIQGAVKDSVNPAFKSKYADLAAVWDACRRPLADNGLSIAQLPAVDTETGRVSVTTILLHASGQYISTTFSIRPGKDDAHGIGSAVTYARRFSLAAMVGVAPEDDDGNAAAAKTQAPARATAPEGHQDWRDNMTAAADSGTTALQKAWTESSPTHRTYAGQDFIAALKARAAAADAKTKTEKVPA